MAEVLLAFFRTGLYGSLMILFILLLRPLLDKAPRNVLCVLWLLVAVRLLLPFQIESKLSLQPSFESYESVVATLPEESDSSPEPAPVVPETTPAPVEPMPLPENPQGVEKVVDYVQILSVIWFGVAGALVLYAVITYCVLRHRVRFAVLCEDGAWESDAIRGAFLLGFFKPKIYLPLGLSAQDREFIIAHERVHMRRGDNWWKLLGMLCTCIHWYNPLVWLSYVLLCRDVELACDEQVICALSTEARKAYSYALLNSGKRTSRILAYPVAFGEVSLKQRIQNVLSYRSPGFWLTVVAVVLATGIVVCFMTTPEKETRDIQQNMHADGTEESTQGTESTEASKNTETTEITESTQGTTAPTQPVITTQPPVTEPVNTQPYDENDVYVINGANWSNQGVMWKVDSAETLTFMGNGYMPPLYQGKNYPWKVYSINITKVVVEDGVTNVPRDVCSEMEYVTQVHLGSKVTTIGKYAFEKCTALQSVTISNATTTIGEGAFRKCIELTSIHIPDSVTEIEQYAFEDCKNLKTVTLSNRLFKLRSAVFAGSGLVSITVPGSVKTIEIYAFENCKNLQVITLSEGLSEIEEKAFAGSGLQSITIPASVTALGRQLFKDSAIKEIVFLGDVPKNIHEDAFGGVTATVYYPKDNPTWTEEARDNYGGNITWVAQ